MYLKILETIINFTRNVKILIQIALDIFLIIFSLNLAMFLRIDNFNFIFQKDIWIIISIILPITILAFYKLNFYNSIIRYISNKILLNFFLGSFISSLLIFAFSQYLILFVPRSVPIIYFMLLFLFLAKN